MARFERGRTLRPLRCPRVFSAAARCHRSRRAVKASTGPRSLRSYLRAFGRLQASVKSFFPIQRCCPSASLPFGFLGFRLVTTSLFTHPRRSRSQMSSGLVKNNPYCLWPYVVGIRHFSTYRRWLKYANLNLMLLLAFPS